MELIRSLNEININQDNFPVFFHDRWIEFEKSDNGTSFIYYNNEIKAVVPFKVFKQYIFRKANYVYVPLNLTGARLSSDEEKIFVDSFHDFLKKENICDVIYPPSHFSVFNVIPQKVIYYEIGTLKIDLTMTEDSLISNMDSDYRKKIRKAEKLGIDIKFGPEFIDDFYSSYKETHIQQGMVPESYDYFKKMVNTLGSNCLIGVAYYEESLEGSILIIKDKKSAFSFFSGTPKTTKFGGSNKYLMYKTFLYLKELGIEHFHYGGARLGDLRESKLERIQDFKIRFGAFTEKGYQFISPINKTRFLLYKISIKLYGLIKRRKLTLINSTGLVFIKSK